MTHSFGAGHLLRFSLFLTLVSVPCLGWLLRGDPDRPYFYVFCLAGFVAVFFTWPRPIHFDSDGIRQRNLIGRTRFIPWPAVEVVRHSSGGKTIVGFGPDNMEIVHSQLHTDRDLFCRLISERT